MPTILDPTAPPVAAPVTRDGVRARVARIIVDALGTDTDPATIADTAILTDLGLDSLDTVEIVMALEEHFDIETTVASIDTVATLGDVTDAVVKALAAAGRPVAGEVA